MIKGRVQEKYKSVVFDHNFGGGHSGPIMGVIE